MMINHNNNNNHEQKRQRTTTRAGMMLQRRYTMAEKEKAAAVVHKRPERQADCLHIKVFHGVDIDKDLRKVTNERYYGVRGWVKPGEVFMITDFIRPDLNLLQLDPHWDQNDDHVRIPMRDVRLEDGVLNLEVVRGMKHVDVANADLAGPSSMRWVVGKVEIKLDELPGNRLVVENVGLLQKSGDCQWRPEGHLRIHMMLKLRPANGFQF